MLSLSDVLDEVQRRTGWRMDEVILRASIVACALPPIKDARVRWRPLQEVLLAGVEPLPWRKA